MKKIKGAKQDKGSMTVEAALIVPVIIFVMFWLLNMAFVLYQYSVLQSIANQGVESAQAAWDNPAKNLNTGRVKESLEFKKEPIYWNVDDKNEEKQIQAIEKWVKGKVLEDKMMDIFTRQSKVPVSVEIEVSNMSYLRRSIKLKIIDNRNTIFSPIRKQFSLAETSNVTVVSHGFIHDPVEFIRNLDWGADVAGTESVQKQNSREVSTLKRVEEIREKCIETIGGGSK